MGRWSQKGGTSALRAPSRYCHGPNWPMTGICTMVEASHEWRDVDVLDVDGVHFVAANTHRFRSTAERFCLVKGPELVERYISLLADLAPRTILELGIFQGGSTALLALLADPQLLIALERSPNRVAGLDELIEQRGIADRVHAVYGLDQSDVPALRAVLAELADGVEFDLIIDDASHLVAETRTSFNVLFPRLRAGGVFVIEDWSWAHIGYGLHRPDELPLTQLVFELTMALPSRPGLISEIRIDENWAAIVRGERSLHPDDFDISTCYSDRARALLASPDL